MVRRISLHQEDRIWALRCQGHRYAVIGAITGVSPYSITRVLRRVRRRPAASDDPRQGRRRAFLSDYQVAEIRRRRQQGEPLQTLASSYPLSQTAISLLARGRTYAAAESRQPPVPAAARFANRLLRA